MLILLDARPLQYSSPDSERTFLIVSVVGSLTREHGVKWILVADQTWRPGSLPGIAEKDVLVRRALPGRVGWRLWYDWQIPRLVKKYRPHRVMVTGGIAAGPSPAPQSVWMPMDANPKERAKGSRLYVSRLGETLRRAESFFCFSEQDRDWLAARARTGGDRFGLIRPWPSAAAGPLSQEGRATVKDRFALGREFFFADVSNAGEAAIVHLLKAFSFFKKRQLSNLQLLLAGDPRANVREKLETYKYRADIHWCGLSEACDEKVPAAAYAALYLFAGDSTGKQMLDSWAAGVPVVVSAGTPMAGMARDAALCAPQDDPTALAGHLMSLYKDESLRGRLIENGFSRLPEYSAGATTSSVWAVIDRAFADIQH
jgi:glycosyltransferase involved in cell wall biosynthesis